MGLRLEKGQQHEPQRDPGQRELTSPREHGEAARSKACNEDGGEQREPLPLDAAPSCAREPQNERAGEQAWPYGSEYGAQCGAHVSRIGRRHCRRDGCKS